MKGFSPVDFVKQIGHLLPEWPLQSLADRLYPRPANHVDDSHIVDEVGHTFMLIHELVKLLVDVIPRQYVGHPTNGYDFSGTARLALVAAVDDRFGR